MCTCSLKCPRIHIANEEDQYFEFGSFSQIERIRKMSHPFHQLHALFPLYGVKLFLVELECSTWTFKYGCLVWINLNAEIFHYSKLYKDIHDIQL